MKKILSFLFMFGFIVTLFAGDRSSQWNKVRKTHLILNPKCELCGSTKSVQVHHIMVFQHHPELELEPSNLMTVCTSKYWGNGVNCHIIAHGGSFMFENPEARTDVEVLKEIGLRTECYKTGAGCMDNDEFTSIIKEIYPRVRKYNCDLYKKCDKEELKKIEN